MLIQNRWYQEAAIDAIFSYFASNNGNPVLAMPTGTGKSIVIALFIYRVMQQWPSQRFIVGTPAKELVKQNSGKLAEVWPHAPFGIHSDGLGARDTMQPIIFGGIQSMWRTPELFGHRDIFFIDECDLLNPKTGSMFIEFIKGLRKINPRMKVIGLTATMYRQGLGLITDPHEGRIFTDVAYDLTTLEAFNRLIAEGFLAPLIPKRTHTEIDTSNLHISSSTGDYVQTELETEAEKITYAALQETMRYAHNRFSWLVFCSGVKHAVKTADMLNHFGVSATVVHSNTKDFKIDPGARDERIASWMQGNYRAITNNNILTVGIDHPPIDLILMLRSTISTRLWVQMLGRGTRPFGGNYLFPAKWNCLVLDFGGNTRRLGPINDPVIPRRKGQGTGDAPVRICEECGTYNHASARVCIGCGIEFTFETKIVQHAGTDEVLRSDAPQIETFSVNHVRYYRHQSKKKPLPSLKVVYYTNETIIPFTEYVNLEHQGPASKFAREWWRTRHSSEPPTTIKDALEQVALLRVPSRIRVHVNKPYPEIIGHEYDY